MFAALQEIREVGRILRSGATKSNFESLVAVIDVDDVALFGEFDSVLVGKFGKAPENSPRAAGLAVIETVGTARLLCVLDRQIPLPAQRLDALLNKQARFGRVGVFLRNGGVGLHWRRRRLGGPALRPAGDAYQCGEEYVFHQDYYKMLKSACLCSQIFDE